MTFKLEQGKPGEKICEVALKDKVKFIVLGSRGMGAIRRTVLGSVSTYVIHHTKIPVIFCPRDHNFLNKILTITVRKVLKLQFENHVVDPQKVLIFFIENDWLNFYIN